MCKYQCHVCGSCAHWLHNKCNGVKGVKGTMCPCPDFSCASCLGISCPIDGTEKMEVEFGD